LNQVGTDGVIQLRDKNTLQNFSDGGGSLGAVGDVNGDGLEDVYLGSSTGVGQVLLGTTSQSSILIDTNDPPSVNAGVLSLENPSAPGEVGNAVPMGDLNGDGYDDFAVGEPYAGSPNGNGIVNVIFG